MFVQCLKTIPRFFSVLIVSVYSLQAAAVAEYLLGGGDVVSIFVYQQPDLTTEARLSQDDGSITFPLLGEVIISGLSSEQAGQKITRLLREGGFIKKPQVTVTVKTYRSQKIPVMGEVNNPGEYSLMGESRVIDLITQAGGLKSTAADIIFVVKKEGGDTVKHKIDLLRFYAGDMTQNMLVSRGDFILVPKMDTFYIHGEVKRAGAYRLERDMTVVQAVTVGGGVSARGSLKGIKVTRERDDGTTEKSTVELADKVQPNDVLYVKERLF